METTKLSSKGQVIIPKYFREAHHWQTGLELQVIEIGDGVLLKPKPPFAQTTWEEAAGCLSCAGKVKSQEEIDAAMRRAAKEVWRGGD